MDATTQGARIKRAHEEIGMSQRALERKTGIPQATLSRIITGSRPAKMNELLAIATATGCTVAELTGNSRVADRVEYAARATNGANMDDMRHRLLHFLELDAYLDDQGIAATG